MSGSPDDRDLFSILEQRPRGKVAAGSRVVSASYDLTTLALVHIGNQKPLLNRLGRKRPRPSVSICTLFAHALRPDRRMRKRG